MPATSELTTRFSPPEVAKRLRVNAQKVIGWIRSGELRAVNIAAKIGGRPRYRISEADLLAFENRRAGAEVKPTKRRRQRELVTNYF